MMFRAVARVVLPLAFAATLCLPGAAQSSTAPQKPGQMPNEPSAKNAATIGSSSSLDANPNDLASLYGTPVEQIIARVNDRVITNSDIVRAQSQLADGSRQGNWSLEQYNRGEKNLLRDLIDQQLLLSKGKQLGISGDTDLIKRLDEIRKQNHLGSLDDLEKAVEQQGISYEDFKANIRHTIVTQEVVRNEVGSRMQIAPAEIRKYYNDHLDSFSQPESVHLNEILIPTAENASGSQLNAAEAKAAEVESKLKGGGSFASLAKQYSGGPTAAQGGDLGEFKRGALAKVLEDQTFNLPVDGYTGPIRTRQGYIILQVTAHNPGGTPALQKVEPQIEQTLYMQKIQPAVRRYLTRLRNEAYIDIRPGYTDSAASPNETKPTFMAYVPPQPKKKKKKKRFDRRVGRYGRMSDRNKAAATTAVASNAVPPPPAGTTATTAAAPAKAHSGHLARVRGRKRSGHKTKRQKLRYGQPPATPVSAEQVATAGGAGKSATAAAGSATAPEAPGSDVQPLGPDLEHNPTITQPKQTKSRFSDRARVKVAAKAGKHHRHGRRVKKVKQDNAMPTALTPAEAANQSVQSAPLGLSGDTVHKKKKKKIKVKNGEKTRLSDQKKANTEATGSGSGADTSSPGPTAQQPQ